MQHHDQPERQLIAQLAGLVAKDLLRHQRTRPAAGQLEEMQCGFRCAPAILQRAVLVAPVEDEGQQAGDGIDRQRQHRTEAQEAARQRQQTEQPEQHQFEGKLLDVAGDQLASRLASGPRRRARTGLLLVRLALTARALANRWLVQRQRRIQPQMLGT